MTDEARRQRGLFAGPPSPHAAPTGARHALRLGDRLVPYELRRARRRSIGLSIGPEGLSVSAPARLALAEIEAALQRKGDWVLRKLAEQAARSEALQRARIVWGDGAELPLLGAPLRLKLESGRRGVALDGALLAPAGDGTPRTLKLGLTAAATPQEIGDAVRRWLQRAARELFEARVRHFAPQLGVPGPRLGLSSARTRWGSASASGAIRLNWRLIHFPLPLIDYVVVHELAHLREMNHGPRFWALVAAVLPDHEPRRRALRDCVAPPLD